MKKISLKMSEKRKKVFSLNLLKLKKISESPSNPPRLSSAK
tara:strand:+ start:1219 stop:1341 length:123 start_codon:yes stop_codon:yes gene_type:complete